MEIKPLNHGSSMPRFFHDWSYYWFPRHPNESICYKVRTDCSANERIMDLSIVDGEPVVKTYVEDPVAVANIPFELDQIRVRMSRYIARRLENM